MLNKVTVKTSTLSRLSLGLFDRLGQAMYFTKVDQGFLPSLDCGNGQTKDNMDDEVGAFEGW